MVFPKEMYDGASKFSVSLDSVWRPEVMLLNNADRTYEPTFPSNVLITPEGMICIIQSEYQKLLSVEEL